MPLAISLEYEKPRTLQEAVRQLSRPGSMALAGGTDLVAWMRDGLVSPRRVVDLKGLAALKRLTAKDRVLRIGALTTFSELAASSVVARRFPLLHEMTRFVASEGIRNRATIAGNICSAVPCCDAGPVLLVYEATVLVRGSRGVRRIPISKWFLGPRRTALRRGEIVTEVSVPLPRKRHAGCFVKLRRYRGEDLAQASVAVLALEGGEYRIAFGAVAPTPLRAPKTEKILAGHALSDELLDRAAQAASQEIAPITDIRASAEYRRWMISVMLKRALRAAAARMAGGGPEYGVDLMEVVP